jgi:hypothetical protein
MVEIETDAYNEKGERVRMCTLDTGSGSETVAFGKTMTAKNAILTHLAAWCTVHDIEL